MDLRKHLIVVEEIGSEAGRTTRGRSTTSTR